MKIGFVFDDSLDKSDGVQQYIFTVSKWLINQGHEVHFLVGQTKRTDLPNLHSLSRNISVNFNGNQVSIPLPTRRRQLKQLLESEKFDVLHIQVPYSPFLAGNIIASAPKSTAVVGTFHILPYGWFERQATRLLGWVSRPTLHRFDAHCAVSSAARDFAKWAYGIEAEVIPNAVETDRFAVDSPQDQKAVVFLGRLVERKGALEFLHAIAALPADMRAKHPVIVAGRGPLEQNLKQYAAAHNLEVNFLGFVDEADKPALLASAELAVFPSISGESFGIVLIEAMAAGSGMVIAGNNPGYASVLANTPEALVNPRDITSFPALIARSLEDESFRKDIHERQEKLVKEFNIASVGPNLINLYSSAIAKQR